MTATASKKETGRVVCVIVETLKTVVFALFIAFILRSFLFQPFHIPSSSMEPTLVKGDYIITSKYSLGYGRYAMSPLAIPVKKGRFFERQPKRGDIIVFKPVGNQEHYIKRLVGLPGDEIQMQNGYLFINGVAQQSEELSVTMETDSVGNPLKFHQLKELLIGMEKSFLTLNKQFGSETDNTGVYSVPVGTHFFLGDNRDQSLDSRYPTNVGGVGFVPASHLVGRAEFILLSVEDGFSLRKPWTWGKMRKERFLKGLR